MILFDSLTIRGVTLPHRIVVSPMCQYSSVDGFADDWHLVHLGSRAVGGAGLVFVEASGVTSEGRITPGDMGIYDDRHVERLSRIARFINRMGSVPASRMILRQALRPVAIGVVIGLIGSSWLGRLLRTFNHNAEPVSGAISIAAGSATRRIVRVDPLQALRSE